MPFSRRVMGVRVVVNADEAGKEGLDCQNQVSALCQVGSGF